MQGFTQLLTLVQKKFVDSVNGKSGLTYFDALESEVCCYVTIDFDLLTRLQSKSTTAIENIFPEVLRDPILRKVQFSTISRVDDLGLSIYPLYPGILLISVSERRL
jgi:hypothetical protein